MEIPRESPAKPRAHFKIKLKQVLEARGLTRNYLACKTGAAYSVIDRWYRGTPQCIDLDLLARICYVLNCRVEDLIEYSRNE